MSAIVRVERGLILAALVIGLFGCSSTTTLRDQAIAACRQAGYLSAVEDATQWYCYKGPPLSLPQPAPVK